MSEPILDYVAVGVGPANLSLAALATGRPGLRRVHLERQQRFAWHPGLLLPEATLQVSYLKDLVTPVDPTSPYSFLAFLVEKGRFYEFVTADFPAVHRVEFDEYLAWVAERVPCVRFGVEVRSIAFEGGTFTVRSDDETFRSRHLVLGTGQRPAVPAAFQALAPRPTLFHASELLHRRAEVEGRRIAVVGGGQSGAEVVRHLLGAARPPTEIVWITRRPCLAPLDDSAFANELFFPEAAEAFFTLPVGQRAKRLAIEKYASDGIDAELLAQIYRHRYLIKHTTGRADPIRVLTGHEVVRAEVTPTGYRLWSTAAGRQLGIDVEVAVLATGYTQSTPPCAEPVAAMLHRHDGAPLMRADFSVEWDGPEENRIFVQNAARHAFGIADPNLSLVAWRSDRILTSIQQQLDRRRVDEQTVPPLPADSVEVGRLPPDGDGLDRHRQYAG